MLAPDLLPIAFLESRGLPVRELVPATQNGFVSQKTHRRGPQGLRVSPVGPSIMFRGAMYGHVNGGGRRNIGTASSRLQPLEFVQRPIHAAFQVGFIPAELAVGIGVPDGICGNA